MKNDRPEFTVIEGLIVIGIILCLLAVGAENILNAMRESEERSVDAAAMQYTTLRATYAAMYRAPAQPAASSNAPNY